jgi:2-polyprenyl-3-methyl-5-hydroxy-6-metoxy-1,4-benzoquinol methylase
MQQTINNASVCAVILDFPGSGAIHDLVKQLIKCSSNNLGGLFILKISRDTELKELATEIKDKFDVKIAYKELSHKSYGLGLKTAYNWAIANNFKALFTIEGHNKFDLSKLPEMLQMVLDDDADLVIGSRFCNSFDLNKTVKKNYRYFANLALSKFGRLVTDINIFDWHSGFRVISVDALRAIPYINNSDSFSFDFELLLQFREMGLKILEVPTAFYSGDNMTIIDGVIFAKDVVIDVLRYRAHKIGFGTGLSAFNSLSYEIKDDERSSHGKIISIMSNLPPGKVLDVGCSDGTLGARIRDFGHYVVGVDLFETENTKKNLNEFYVCDLDQGLPLDGQSFDYVIMADVLEHLKEPERLLKQAKSLLFQNGKMIISVPNVGHWYARVKVGLGLFDYDRRGIFDKGHLRFFTKISFSRLLAACGLKIVSYSAVGLPLSVFKRASSGKADNIQVFKTLKSLLGDLQTVLTKFYPELFGYQFIFIVETEPDEFESYQYVEIS